MSIIDFEEFITGTLEFKFKMSVPQKKGLWKIYVNKAKDEEIIIDLASKPPEIHFISSMFFKKQEYQLKQIEGFRFFMETEIPSEKIISEIFRQNKEKLALHIENIARKLNE